MSFESEALPPSSSYQPSWYEIPPEANVDTYADWLSPDTVREILDFRQHITETVEVPEIASVDVDDTIIPKEQNLERLYEAVRTAGSLVDVAELQHLCENTRGFSPVQYLFKQAGVENFRKIMNNYQLAYSPDDVSAASRRMFARLDNAGVPHFLNTFGQPEWQIPKIAGPGLSATRSITGALVVPERVKLPFLDTFRHEEGYMVQEVNPLPPARFVTQLVVHIDDNLQSLSGFSKGFWLNEKQPAGTTELPDGIVEVSSLDEIGIIDGVLIKVPTQTDEPQRQHRESKSSMPVLNRDSELAPRVWSGYII